MYTRLTYKITPATDSCLSSDLAAIRSDLMNVQELATLLQPEHFADRATAIDFLEFHILDRIEGLVARSAHPELIALQEQTLQVKTALEHADMLLFRQLRDAIIAGTCRGALLLEKLYSYSGHDTAESHAGREQPGYDHGDTLLNGLLASHPLPEATLEREKDMVFYQQTPARIMMQLAEQAAFTAEDHFFDLGSGLGQVAIFIHLLTGVPATGIEYEPAYCGYATACATQLHLPAVTFINQDARNASYGSGTVFFLYTPFEGAMLQQVLALLQQEATKRTIRIFTYGPCSATAARQSWLLLLQGRPESPYTLCQFLAGASSADH